jgi:uncharacterized protein YukE
MPPGRSPADMWCAHDTGMSCEYPMRCTLQPSCRPGYVHDIADWRHGTQTRPYREALKVMPVQVVVGANAQNNAQAFLSAVTEFTQAVQKLQSTGRQLVISGDWQGKSATAFDADFQQFTRQVQLMDQSLTKMAGGAKTVITTIDNTDQAGARSCGSFQFFEHWSSQKSQPVPPMPAPSIHSAPSLSLTIPVIQMMNIAQRRAWIMSVLNYYGPAFRVDSSFDRNIYGVLAFLEDDGLGTNGSWASWTDSTILNGIERGLAMARGSTDSQGNPGAVKWAAFFQDTKKEGLVFNDMQRKLWSHAEDAAAWYGMTNVGPAHGAYPTPQELAIGTGAQVYRWALRHQPGVDRVANATCGQICVSLANDATDPRYFDPTFDGAHVLSGITQTDVGLFTGNLYEAASGEVETGRYVVKGIRDLVGW